MNIKKYFKLIRIHQWIKNFFLVIPLIFSGDFIYLDKDIRVVIGFFAFCFLASSMYIMNDINDVEEDRKHSTKKYRPIASGEISIKKALFIAMALFLGSILLSTLLSYSYIAVLLLYLVLNLIYTHYTKHIPVWDILFLASFYIVRIFAGGVAIDVNLSSWLFLTAFFATLFIGSGKRYVELATNGKSSRKVLSFYSHEFLNYCLALSSFCTILFYTLYTTTKSFYFQISSVFVVVGFLNYFFLLYRKDIHEDPVSALLKSKSMFLVLAGWLVYVLILLRFSL